VARCTGVWRMDIPAFSRSERARQAISFVEPACRAKAHFDAWVKTFFSLFFCISLLTRAPNRYLGQHRISLSVFVRVGCFFQSTATRRLFALTVWNLVCLDGGMGWLRYRVVIGCPAFSSLPWVLARRCCKYVGQAMLQNPSAWPSEPNLSSSLGDGGAKLSGGRLRASVDDGGAWLAVFTWAGNRHANRGRAS